MNAGARPKIVDLPELRNRVGVFRDRTCAGEVLASLLEQHSETNATVLAIPAGGVPVGLEIAKRLRLPLDLMVVSKITLPWNTETGYGAVAFDGSVELNEPLLRTLGLTDAQIQDGIARTRVKVTRRVARLRGDRPFPDLAGLTAMLVDDGLASGFTMWAAVGAARRAGSRRVVVTVPTGHDRAVRWLAEQADVVYCANIRTGLSFAVADAYEQWSDIGDEELSQLLGAAP